MAQEKEVKMVNGVNVSQLMANIAAIQQAPSLASFNFRITNRWLDGGLNRSTIGDFDGTGQTHVRQQPFTVDADEPPVLLSEDRAANPVEYVLHALAACLTTGMVYHAAARGIRLEEVESRLEGDLDLRGFLGLSDKVRRGYEGIRVTFRVKGDATPEQLLELCNFSPVYDIVSNPVPVTLRIEKA
jgi:uncharacterized OsmC-like protein